MDIPHKAGKDDNQVWAEFDFDTDNFEKNFEKKQREITDKVDETKLEKNTRSSKSDKKKPRKKSSHDVERAIEDKSVHSVDQPSIRKSKEPSEGKHRRDGTPTKREPRRGSTNEESTRTKKPIEEQKCRKVTPPKKRESRRSSKVESTRSKSPTDEKHHRDGKEPKSVSRLTSKHESTSSRGPVEEKRPRDGTKTRKESHRTTKPVTNRSESPVAATSRRREKVKERSAAPEEKSKAKKENRRVSSEFPLKRPVPTDISSSRARAVQRAEARNAWRDKVAPKETNMKVGSDTDYDDALDAKVKKSKDSQNHDDYRMSILDQSRKGPVRAMSRLKGKSGEADDSDNSDDCSVYSYASNCSAMSSASNTSRLRGGIEGPFPSSFSRRASCAGSYLPSELNKPPDEGKRVRRASAFGSSLDRALAIYDSKADDSETDDDASCAGKSVYSMASVGSQFEIDRAGNTKTKTNRPSTNMVLTIPNVIGGDSELSRSDHKSSADKSDRWGKFKRVQSTDSLQCSAHSASKPKPNEKRRPSVDDKKGANYDSAVDDVLKNRRLFGDRDSVSRTRTKKEEEKLPAQKRKSTISLLTNLVQPLS